MTALLEIVDIDILTPKSLPNIGVYKILLHIVQFVLAFIVLCLSATVISSERAYYAASQSAVNFSLVISLLSIFILVPMIIIPWTKLNAVFPTRLREGFFLKSRPNLVFNVFLTICWFSAMVAVAVHSNNDANCSLDSELEKKDSNYVKSWLNQCNCAKAAAAFCVFCFFLWISTTIICVILFWHEKKLDHSSDSSTVIEEPSNKEEELDMVRSSLEEKQDPEVALPSPTTTPLTLTNDFVSPYSPSVTHSPQPMAEPYNSIPPSPHQISAPYTPQPEYSYIPPQNTYTPSPLSQSFTSPHISAVNSPYGARMSYPPAIQSPPLHHNPAFQPMYQHSYYP